MPHFLQRLPPRLVLWGLLALSALVYVGNTWSPSSYALTLRQFGAEEDGLVLGTARGIRSDEWAVITPMTQAAVNNGLARYNARSFYGEDLRSTCTLPLLDWGLVFKPTMWLYPLVNAAYAFSFHHFAVIALFLIGHARLFRRFGLGNAPAILLSLGLFFTSFAQYWWTTLGPLMAWFPWVLWVFLSDAPLAVRLPAFYWVATTWLMASFYPPFFIPMGFAAVALLLAFKPERLRQPKVLLGFAVMGVLACATTLFYLQDWLLGVLHTVYPGERRIGGGDFGWDRFLSVFLPTVRLHHHKSLVPAFNPCEMAVAGSLYLLMVLCFLRYGALREAWKQGRLWPVKVLLPAVLLMSIWLLLPVPPALGKPLLWHLVPPVRMAFAYGLMLFLLAYVLSESAGLEPSPLRVLLFAGVLFGAWYQYKLAAHGIRLGSSWGDFTVLVPVTAVCIGLYTGRLARAFVHPALLGGAVLVAAISFGLFNPLQRAWPIFNRPETDVTRALDAQAAASPGGVLVVGGFNGAILNGWGYRSASHVLMSPQVERFQHMFPELPPERVNFIFNRYAHVSLTTARWPGLLNTDAVALPARVFASGQEKGRWIFPSLEMPPSDAQQRREGYVEDAHIEGNNLVLSGWVPWEELSDAQGLLVRTGSYSLGATIEPVTRPDVAKALGGERYLRSGFIARIPLISIPSDPRTLPLCVVAVDRQKGWSLRLSTPAGFQSCG